MSTYREFLITGVPAYLLKTIFSSVQFSSDKVLFTSYLAVITPRKTHHQISPHVFNTDQQPFFQRACGRPFVPSPSARNLPRRSPWHHARAKMLVAGARVQLQNIVTQTELNGQYGELVAEASQGEGRWKVRVDGREKKLALKPENLKLVEEEFEEEVAAAPEIVGVKRKGGADRVALVLRQQGPQLEVEYEDGEKAWVGAEALEQSVPMTAPQLGSCASSGRRHTGRSATASGARASRLQSRAFHRL